MGALDLCYIRVPYDYSLHTRYPGCGHSPSLLRGSACHLKMATRRPQQCIPVPCVDGGFSSRPATRLSPAMAHASDHDSWRKMPLQGLVAWMVMHSMLVATALAARMTATGRRTMRASRSWNPVTRARQKYIVKWRNFSSLFNMSYARFRSTMFAMIMAVAIHSVSLQSCHAASCCLSFLPGIGSGGDPAIENVQAHGQNKHTDMQSPGKPDKECNEIDMLKPESESLHEYDHLPYLYSGVRHSHGDERGSMGADSWVMSSARTLQSTLTPQMTSDQDGTDVLLLEQRESRSESHGTVEILKSQL